MYSVGLDVDTKVSLIIVILLIIIGLYAENLFNAKGSIGKFIEEKICMVNCNLTNKIEEEPAGNLELVFNDDLDTVFLFFLGFVFFEIKSQKKHSSWCFPYFFFTFGDEKISRGETKPWKNTEKVSITDLDISDHMKKHSKPSNDEDFGYYLAGLIEGNGLINSSEFIEIAFHEKDISLAYYIKKRIGCGTVIIKQNNSVKYLVGNKGLEKLIHLVNGKFLSQSKINQLIENNYENKFSFKLLPKGKPNILSNYWLAGFTDALGSFTINTSKYHEGIIDFIFSISHKRPELLSLIKQDLGGDIIVLPCDSFLYISKDIRQIKNLIQYFDDYNLLSASKLVNYFKWRRGYRIYQRYEHLTENGMPKLIKIREYLRD